MRVRNANRPAVGVASPRAVLAIVATAIFVSNLDLFVVNVALPDIGQDFHGSALTSLSWVLNAYAIVFAALLVPAGRLADRTSHRGGFLLGLLVFVAASAACAAAPSVPFLVGARIVQAAGAALLVPTSLALLLAATPAEKRSGAVRAWTAVGGVAAALGPVIGGLLVDLDWRWIFLINLPVGVVAIAYGLRRLPDVRGTETGPLPDLAGASLLTAAIALLALGLVQGNDWGWRSAGVIGSLVGAAVLLAAFLLRSARHPVPVVELGLLRVRVFAVSTGAAFLFSVSFAAMLLSVVLWCQQVWGWSALLTGLAIAPGPLMVPALAVGAGPLARRVGAGPVAAAGTVLLAAGMLWWAVRLSPTRAYATDLLPGMLLTGIGVGLALPTLVSTAATSLPGHRFATGSAVVNMARQVGSVIGVAVLVSILGTVAGVRSFHRGWVVMASISLVAAVLSLRLPRPAWRNSPAAPVAATDRKVPVPEVHDDDVEDMVHHRVVPRFRPRVGDRGAGAR